MTNSPTNDSSGLIRDAASELRVSNGIAVLGAGASFEAGMPLAGSLAPLVWQTLEEHIDVRRQTAARLSVPDTFAKDLVGNGWERVTAAFELIKSNPSACVAFQETFSRLDRDRRLQYSASHDGLSRLIQCQLVEFVVSLNWDTLLETAFSERYGTNINANDVRLVKPHGDANHPESPWILPHEQGFVSDELVRRVQSFVSH